MNIIHKIDKLTASLAVKSSLVLYSEVLGFGTIAYILQQEYYITARLILAMGALAMIELLLTETIFCSYWIALRFYFNFGIWPIRKITPSKRIAYHAIVQEKLLPLQQQLIIAAAHDLLSNIAHDIKLKIQTAEDIASDNYDYDDNEAGEDWKQLLSAPDRRYEPQKNIPYHNGREVVEQLTKLNNSCFLAQYYDTHYSKTPNIVLYNTDNISVN